MYKDLEAALSYTFLRPEKLKEVLKHPSLRKRNEVSLYERYEFLGDRVLALIIAHLLFKTYPEEDEGLLAKRHAHYVSRDAFHFLAQHLNLDRYVQCSSLEGRTGGKERISLLSDSFEALIGYIYEEAGFQKAYAVVEHLWQSVMQELPHALFSNPKSSVQEWAQKRGKGIPRYVILDKEGPQHAPLFRVELFVEGFPSHKGEGASLKAAERQAAEAFLSTLKDQNKTS